MLCFYPQFAGDELGQQRVAQDSEGAGFMQIAVMRSIARTTSLLKSFATFTGGATESRQKVLARDRSNTGPVSLSLKLGTSTLRRSN